MDKAKINDTVSVHYTITYKNGKIYDTTQNKDPLTFVLGGQLFFPGFEETIEGMFIGQSKKKEIPSYKAFGPRLDTLILEINKDRIPNHINQKKGQCVEIDVPPKVKATIIDIKEDTLVLDANPEQAGCAMILEIELLDIMVDNTD